jgi:hypothetical protein
VLEPLNSNIIFFAVAKLVAARVRHEVELTPSQLERSPRQGREPEFSRFTQPEAVSTVQIHN